MVTLILPAYQIALSLQREQEPHKYKLDGVRDVYTELKWEMKKHEPSIFTLNQLLQHLLQTLYDINIPDSLVLFLRNMKNIMQHNES